MLPTLAMSFADSTTPFPRQGAGEGAVRVAVEQRLQIVVDTGDRLARLQGICAFADHVGVDGLADSKKLGPSGQTRTEKNRNLTVAADPKDT
jgi:hypothetical protein